EPAIPLIEVAGPVGEEVAANEISQILALIQVPAHDHGMVVMIILDYGIYERLPFSPYLRAAGRRVIRALRIEAMSPLPDVPAVVSTLFHQVHLLPEVLAGIGNEQAPM